MIGVLLLKYSYSERCTAIKGCTAAMRKKEGDVQKQGGGDSNKEMYSYTRNGVNKGMYNYQERFYS